MNNEWINEGMGSKISTIYLSINIHHRNNTHTQMDPPYRTSQVFLKAFREHKKLHLVFGKTKEWFLGPHNTLQTWPEHISSCVCSSTLEACRGPEAHCRPDRSWLLYLKVESYLAPGWAMETPVLKHWLLSTTEMS